jgi:4-amino-4-deoxy-L-arabinose transferase-like glycosyltransferase
MKLAGVAKPQDPPAPIQAPNPYEHWPRSRSYALLFLFTLAALIPFCAKPFNIDDPLFLWSARQIVHHPLDPYGFQVNWYRTSLPMWQETKNPPLGCYYAAAAAWVAGWSEVGLHLAFLAPALAVVLGTYRLALRFTRFPFLAAIATLLTPGFLMASTSIMCDVLMLAFWVWAAILWFEGLESSRSSYLLGSAFLIALSAMTKYFGIMLVPLLALYSYQKTRRWGPWIWYLFGPVLAMGGFELWSKLHYGHGLVSAASSFSRTIRRHRHSPLIAQLLVGLSFVGGCTVPVLAWLFLSWPPRRVLIAITFAVPGALALCSHWLALDANSALPDFSQHYASIAIQLTLSILGGIALLALPFSHFGNKWDADHLVLTLWLVGTFLFAAFLNWITSARSVLPLIPAAAILLACRIERACQVSGRVPWTKLAFGLATAAIVTFWVAAADADLARSARKAADMVRDRTGNQATVWFSGHSGFQYYMQQNGAKPIDLDAVPQFRAGDFVVIPDPNRSIFGVRKDLVASQQTIEVQANVGLSTLLPEQGADSYAGGGPLPFVIGQAPPQSYEILRLVTP